MTLASSLIPYPRYEPCALSWLAEIPAGWSVRRIKYVLREVDKRSEDGQGVLFSLTRSRGLIRRSEASSKGAAAASLVGYKLCKPGDVVMNRMQAWSGMFGIAPEAGLVSPDYAVFASLEGNDPRFLLDALRIPTLVAQFAAASKGIGSGFNRLYTDKFGAIGMPLPPPSEQPLLSRYIHHADVGINRFILQKRELIRLLQEQRQATIDTAVLHGIDNTRGGKPLRVEGVSSIPEDWEVWPFVRLAIERADYRGATPEKVASGVFLVTAKNIRMGSIDYETSKEYVREDEYQHIMRRGLPQIGDVLFTTEAPLGHVALVDRTDVAFAQRVIRFRLDQTKVVPEYALYALMSSYFQNQLRVRATGSTAQGIKASKLPQLRIALPPKGDQTRILGHLSRELGTIDTAIHRAEREIGLILEYRARLVSDIATGALDVRAEARDLPEPGLEAVGKLAVPPETDDESTSEGELELDEVMA